MTPAMLVSNIARYLLQSSTLILAAAGFIWLFRVRAARVRLAILHAVLVGSVALPFVQPVRREFVVPAAPGWGHKDEAARGTPVRIDAGVSAAIVASIIASAGCMARWLWLGAGLMRLRIRRRHATRLCELPAFGYAEDQLAVRARVYLDDKTAGPVTFGFTRPAVLLPPFFLNLPEGAQRSIALHELMHVKRRDWLLTLAEEMIRGLLWFHPAIWWLLDRVQLAREQAVDEEVVRITRDQERYVGALLEIARVRLEPDLASAPLFLRKRQLTERVSFLVKGGQMSKKHVYASVLAVMILLPLATGLVIQAFPLSGAAQVGDADGPGVQVGESPFKFLHRTPIEYPASALDRRISGDVVADLKINEKGEVYDASIVSGPAELRAAVLQSVLNWHYDLSGDSRRPEHFEIAVRFTAPALTGAGRINPAPSGSAFLTLKRIDVSGVARELRDRVLSAIPVHEGDRVNPPEDLSAIAGRVSQIDEHNSVSLRETGPGEAELTIVIGSPKPGGETAKRIRVGREVQQANLLTKVVPHYPALAKQQHIQGTVLLNALIDRQGKIKELELVSGEPVLAEAAVEAVKQWVYRPTLLDLEPVEVMTQIQVNFTLSE